MSGLVRDTIFGRLLQLCSGGRLLPWEEQKDPSKLLKYSEVSPALISDESVETPDVEKTDHEAGKDHQLVDWEENDPENPRNWSSSMKLFVTFQICLLTTSVYIGSAIYTPGIREVSAEFGVSDTVSLIGLTLFVLGYALGPMIWAPMSEMPFFGRNPIYIGTLFAFVLLNLGVYYAKNIGMLLAFRFITGFVGSPVLATGGATIQDIYRPQKAVYGIAVWGLAAVCGPALGPLVGGFAAESKGWRWTILELIWLSAFCFVFLFFCLPETSASNIIYRRTCRYRAATGNSHLKCQPELEAEGLTKDEIIQMTLVRPFTMTFVEPICFALNLYIALIYALLYLWFESFPIVFVGIYHFSLGISGLAFLGILVGFIIIAPIYFLWYRRYQEPKFNEKDELVPELRLLPAFVGAFCIPICLFWFGWSARPNVHWIMPIIGSSFFAFGAFCMFMAVLTYLGEAYPKYVASVYASNDLVRSAFGAAFPLFANAMYKKLGVGWASSLLGFLSIAFIPIPFVLYYFGKSIRLRSKMARHDL